MKVVGTSMTVGMGQTFELEATVPSGNGQRPPSLEAVFELELDGMRSVMAGFPDVDPAEVLMLISGIVGRLAEIRAQLYRVNSQRCTQLRVREVDPLREDLDLQFRLHSRRIALLEWELKLSGGGV